MNLSRRGFLTGVAAAAVASRLPTPSIAAEPSEVLLQGKGTHVFSAYVKAPGEKQWTRVIRHFTPRPGEACGIGWDQARREWMPRTFVLKDAPDSFPNGSGAFEVFGAQIEEHIETPYIATTGSKVTREAASTNLLINSGDLACS